MKSKYIFFVILLVLSSLVVAELTLPDPEQSVFTGEDFNPLNVDSYASVDFYTTVSPSEWNWAYVDWQYVDFSRTDIYANKGLYENLPDSKFKELDYNLVNYKLVPDHDLIDADKYFEDKRFLGNSLYVDSGLERGIIFTQTGFSHPETKTSATLSNYPDYSKYTVTDKGIEVDISIPVGTDKVRTIDTRKTGDALFIKTVDTKGNLIVNGIQMFEGRLGIDSDGRVFVDENSPFLITKKGININTKIKTFVYNDDKPHDDDNYVAIGETDIVARSTVPREGDFVDIDVNLESLGIILPSGVVALIANGEMQYKTREDEGLIPRLLMEFDEVYGFASVSMSSEEYSQKILYNNFRKTIGVDGPIPVSPPESFVLHFSGSSGDDIISDYKVLFVKDQGWAVVPQSVDSSKTECLTCVYDMNFEVSQIFATQKVVDRIQRKYGIPVTSADLSIQSVIDLERKLEDLPVKLRESITSINLRKWDGIQIECGSSSGLVIGCANVMGDIWVNPSYLDGYVLEHESGHTLNFELEYEYAKEREELEQEKRRLLLELRKEYGLEREPERVVSGKPIERTISDLLEEAPFLIENERFLRAQEIDTVLEVQPIFWQDWYRTIEYGMYTTTTVDPHGYTVWKGSQYSNEKDIPTPSTPQYSCPRAYACSDQYEHYASLVEYAANEEYSWDDLFSNNKYAYQTITLLEKVYDDGGIKLEDMRRIREEYADR